MLGTESHFEFTASETILRWKGNWPILTKISGIRAGYNSGKVIDT